MRNRIFDSLKITRGLKCANGLLRLKGLLCVVLPVGALTASVLGCGWFGTDHTVRFNAYRTGKEFGRLPPLPSKLSRQERMLTGRDDEAAYKRERQKLDRIDKLWEEAKKAEQVDLGVARMLLGDYLERTTGAIYKGWWEISRLQKLRNTAIDKLDAMAALDHGSPESKVRSYLKARSAYDAGEEATNIYTALSDARSDRNLLDNVLYLHAAILYRDKSAAAANAFNYLARRYPQSEKREAALLMAGLSSMKQSKSYDGVGEHGGTAPGCADCRDTQWKEAHSYFERVLREYPGGRYSSDARGWLAYLSLLAGDRADALVRYYRLLSDEDDPVARLEAVKSLRLVRHRANDAEMKRVEALLEVEPDAALAYAYHSIYNFALKPLSEYSRYESGGYESNDSELERIAAFSSRLMRRYPGLAIGGAFALRMAQACLELDRNKEAAEFSRRAQKARLDDEERAQALWVEGVAEHRLGNHTAARRALTTIIEKNPNGHLTGGARRNLAMVAEDMGDMDAALEQYLALEYDLDVAYFVDVLMTPEQLSAFIDSRPVAPHRDELRYSLALRHLRDGKWNDARRLLSQIRPTGRGIDDRYAYRLNLPYDELINRQAKDPDYIDYRIRGVRPQWIERDLKTANDLERLESIANAAQEDEAKAEALYQYASYQYQGGSLLFYNPAMWGGGRYHNLGNLYARGDYRRSNEARLLSDYMNSHDVPARALAIYLEIASRFPNTRAARDALYTAAVCHEKLSEYNPYWRDIYETGSHAGNRMVSYRDVKAAYPGYALPRGTVGWEPLTRTVNGGPAIRPPPRPAPRPGRRERLIREASLWIRDMIEGWLGLIDWIARFFKSLWIGFAFSGLVFLWLRASRARKLLQSELAHCPSPPEHVLERPRPQVDILQSGGGLDRFLSQETRDEWIAAARVTHYKLKQLSLEDQGRAVIVSAAKAHAVFLGLLVIWMWSM